MRRVWFIAPVLLAVSLVAIDETAASSSGRPPGPPDTFVSDWDAIGTQAFSAEAAVAAAAHRVLVRYLPIPWCLAPDRGDSAGRCGHR
jgi:hypothetical protein